MPGVRLPPTLLRALERGARLLERLGLGRLVALLGPRLTRAFGPFAARLDGLVLHGDGAAHIHYVEELRAGRERHVVEHLVAAARPGGVVVEAGVHLGWLTLQAARAVGPAGRVIGFEPNGAVLPLVERSLRENGLAGRVTLVPAALSDREGEALLHVTEGGDTSSLFDQGYPAEGRTVRTVVADRYLDPELRADVVKLDVEGAELHALRGMRELLDRSAPGPVVLVECNPAALERAGASAAALVGWLEDAGFDVRWIDERDGRLRALDEEGGRAGYVNLRCERRRSR